MANARIAEKCCPCPMPTLLDTESRTDCLVVSINHILAVDGPTGLTLRRIAKVSGVGTSSMLHHFESREHLIRVAAGRTGRARVDEIRARMPLQGVAGTLPEGAHDLMDARAWLAWLQLWRSEETLFTTILRWKSEERGVVARAIGHPFLSPEVDGVVAMIDGLLGSVCQPAEPLEIEAARQVLTDHVDRLGQASLGEGLR